MWSKKHKKDSRAAPPEGGEPGARGEEKDGAGSAAPPAAAAGAAESQDGAAQPGGDASSKGAAIREKVIEVLKTVYDPEIPVDIYELGLVYEIHVDERARVRIVMTLTSPGCPVAGSMPHEIDYKVRMLEGVSDVQVDLVWDPPWTPDRMSEAARLTLNL